MVDWEIKKTLGKCWGTDEEFVVGQDYYAALMETEEGFERRDYSVGYWQEHKPEAYCFWKTKMADPEEKKQLFIDDEMLMAFFERLAEETEDEEEEDEARPTRGEDALEKPIRLHELRLHFHFKGGLSSPSRI